MPVNQINTNYEVYIGRENLPLQGFFIALKQNGFLVTPEQIIDATRIITQYARFVKNENELKHYLSPLFARNEEEQQQFEDIFHSFFNKGKTVTPVKKQSDIATHTKKHKWKYILGIALTIIALIAVPKMFNKPSVPFHAEIYLLDKDVYVKEKYGKPSFHVNTNEQLNVLTSSVVTAENHKPVTLQTKYNWGDNPGLSTDSSHSYQKQGIYELTAYVDIFLNNEFRYRDTAIQTVSVCAESNTITISTNKKSDSVKVGEKIKFSPNITGNQPDSIRWYFGADNWRYGKELDTVFTTEGRPLINCAAIYDSLEGPCTIINDIEITVYDPNKPTLYISITKAANALPVSTKFKVKSSWFYISGTLSLLSFVLTVAFAMKSNKKKKKQKDKEENTDQIFNQLLHSFSGKKTPAELPFQNKNYLPVPEAEINEAATQMRRRINIEASFLQIQKTIEKSIDNLGFFQPVYMPRLQQSEYLVLIDASHNNNQQVKLFDYLIEVLKKQNVFIEKYYYRYEPKLCFNSLEPKGVSLEKLSEKYDKHILLIFGNAYQLLYQYYPVFDHEYLQLLQRWKNKAVLTPVSFLDWGNKETRALLPQIPVVPVDVEGQLALMEILFNQDYDILAALKQYEKTFYKVEPIDFENVTELEAYCNNASWSRITENEKPVNILYQWIAALSIYPKIKWETILSIGKAILDRYGKGEELNFTNLLRIARIKWMKDGQFPDYTRLDLLKSLTIENEITARETILTLLKEIPESEMNAQHFAYEEKEIQRITNEFILYAYHPVKYAPYKGSKDIFEKLWKEKKITDAPSKVYLKNDQSDWDTLINKASATEGRITKNVPIDKYFEPDKETENKKNKQNFFLVKTFAILMLFSVAGLLFLTVLHFINTNKFPAFTYRPTIEKDIRFNLINNTSVSSDQINLSIDNYNTAGNWNKSVPVPLRINDSLKPIFIYAYGDNNLKTSMQISHDAYDVLVTESKDNKVVNDNVITAVFVIRNECSGLAEKYKKFIQQADSSIQVRDSFINNRSPDANNISNSSGTCMNKIFFGKNIDGKMIRAVLENFERNGITNLEANLGINYSGNPNEIVLFNSKDGISPKPVLYIQYNIKYTYQKVEQLRACLNQNIFSVPGIQYMGNTGSFTRNEIRYHNNSFKDSIRLLQNCLRSVYPDRTFYPVKIKGTNRYSPVEIWVYDTLAREPIGGPDYVFRSMTEALSAEPNLVYKLNLSNQILDKIPPQVYQFPNLTEIDIRETNLSVSEINLLQDHMRKRNGIVRTDEDIGTSREITIGERISIDNAQVRIGPFVQNNAGEQFAVCVLPDTEIRDANVYLGSGENKSLLGTIFLQSKITPLICLVSLKKGLKGKNFSISQYGNRKHEVVIGTGNVQLGDAVDLFDFYKVGRGGDPLSNPGKIIQLDFSGDIGLGQGKSIAIRNALVSDISQGSGLSGSILRDKNNYGVGILVAGDGKRTIFMPLQSILNEFGVKLITPPASGN